MTAHMRVFESEGLDHADPTDADPTDAAAHAHLASGAADGEIDAIRARLAARGLLQTEPAIVVPKEPRSDAPVWIERAVDDGDAAHPREVAEDEWDVDPSGDRYAPQQCPQCRDPRPWPADVTRFRCLRCARAWRWAVCESCDSLALTIERQEAWTCVPCGHATRSWWRTSSAPGDAVEVVARRLSAAAAAERARVRAGMRQRRWKIVAGAFVGLIVVAVFVVAVRAAEPTQVGGTRATCEHFERLRADLSARTVGPARLNSQLDALTAKSATADASVQKAVVDLAAAGRPGQASFLVAETNLADACAAAPRR